MERHIASGTLGVMLAVTGLALPAKASEPDNGNETASASLDSVVVTATRQADDALLVPAAVDVVEAEAFRRAQARVNLSESLQRVPGVVVRNRQNFAQDLQISIRGYGARATFGVRGVRLYTDGIPATMPDGQGQVSHFSLESIDRIEVLRGPYSALYGNASGGVIELFSENVQGPPLLRASHTAGSFDLARSSLSVQSPLFDGGSFLLDAVNVDTDGYREHSRATRRTGQAIVKGGFGRDGTLTVLANTLDLEAQDPQGLTREQLREDRRAASDAAIAFDTRKTVKQEQLGVRLEHDVLQQHAVSVTAYGGNRDTAQLLSIPVFVQQESPLQGGGAFTLDRDYYGMDLRWRWKTALANRPFTLITGVTHEVADEARLGFENFAGTDAEQRIGVFGALRRDEDNRVGNRDVYVQADFVLTDRWRLNAGVRRSEVTFTSTDHFITPENPDDSGSLEYAQTSPVIGVLYRATPTLSLFVNAGTGFETPTFSELAYRPDGASGLNAELEPATGINTEAGLRMNGDRVELSAVVFQGRTDDELIVIQNEGGRSVYGNAVETRRRGFEASLSGDIGSHWHYATAYTFLDAEYSDEFRLAPDALLISAGHAIPGLARHVAWSELRWSPTGTFDVMLEGRFVDRVYVNDVDDQSAPAWARFDISAERRFEGLGIDWRVFARVNNILDRDIIGSVVVNAVADRYYEPAPGRHWVAGVAATLAFD